MPSRRVAELPFNRMYSGTFRVIQKSGKATVQLMSELHITEEHSRRQRVGSAAAVTRCTKDLELWSTRIAIRRDGSLQHEHYTGSLAYVRGA